MDGSPRSARNSTKALLALLALIALVATACGGGAEETTTDQVSAAADDQAADDSDASTDDAATDDDDVIVVEGTEVDDPESDAGLAEDAPEAVDAGEGDEPDEAPAEEADGDAADTNDDDAGPLAQVLAFALTNSETQSYSFTQGMAMRMSIAGLDVNMAPEGAYVTGEVEGDKQHFEANIGVVLASTFESLGMDITEPPFDQILGDLDSATMEMWADESTAVIDMSGLSDFMTNLDPAAASELGLFANGPVSIDLAGLDGVDPATLANQFGQGAQVSDPAQILQALRAVNAATETGTSSVNGVDVRVISAALPMGEYYEALGISFEEQLAAADLGELAGGADAAAADALLESLEDLQVNLVVMIDDEDLVRRLETSIDMGAMLQAMFANPDMLAAIAEEDGQSIDELEAEMADVFGDGLEMQIDVWQEFDNYGESFGITLPDAVDVTDQLDLAS